MFDPSSEAIPAFAAPENDRDPMVIIADQPYDRLFRGGYLREEDIVYKPNIFFGWFRFFLANPDIDRVKAKYKTLENVQRFILSDPAMSRMTKREVLSREQFVETLIH